MLMIMKRLSLLAYFIGITGLVAEVVGFLVKWSHTFLVIGAIGSGFLAFNFHFIEKRPKEASLFAISCFLMLFVLLIT